MDLDLDDDSDNALQVLLLQHAGHDVQSPADAGMSGPEPLAPNGIRRMIDLSNANNFEHIQILTSRRRLLVSLIVTLEQLLETNP